MNDLIYFLHNGFAVFVSAMRTPDGSWEPLVTLEKTSHRQRDLVGGYRYRLHGQAYGTEMEALSAAAEFGRARAAKRDPSNDATFASEQRSSRLPSAPRAQA